MSYAEKRTRTHFQKAFVNLIKEIGYSKVTVRKLVEYADYNRTSFYRYYDNLDQLSEEIIDLIVNKIYYESYIKEKNSPDNKRITYSIYKTIYENSFYFDLLAIEDGIPNLKSNFIKCMENILENEWIFEDDNHMIFQDEYIHSFWIQGTYGMIEMWVKNGYNLNYKIFAEHVHRLYSGSFPNIKTK